MAQRSEHPVPRPEGTRSTPGTFSWLAPALAAAFMILILSSCQSPDPVAKDKDRTLEPDERYLVEYYMKIIEFEKQLHENPELREEKRQELERGMDMVRIRNVLAQLENKPERWLAIYKRINELQLRDLATPPTETH